MSQEGIIAPPPYIYQQAFPYTMSTATPVQPLQSLGKAEILSPDNPPQTLPLIQPMDLSRYNSIYATPMISHNILPISHDRAHHTPGSTPFSGSPDICGQSSYGGHSAFSSPGWEHGHRMTKSFGGLGTGVNPMNMYLPQVPMSSSNLNPFVGKEALPEWRGYQYAQPFVSWDSAPPSEEDEMEKANQRSRRHVCPVCDKRFNRPSSLTTHLTVHTGDKPYQCPRADCGRRFSVSSNLRRHERTHENRRVKDRAQSGDSLELLTDTPGPIRSASSHSHSHSMGSHPYAYPSGQSFNVYAEPTRQQQQLQQNYSSYSYDTAPTLDLGPMTSTGLTPLPTGFSTSGFGHIGVGLEQYSITRRSSSGTSGGGGSGSMRRSGSGDSSEGSVAITPKSPLDGFDLLNGLKSAELQMA